MELVTPAFGLIFWTTVVFLLLVFLLRKFAWTPILTAVEKRNKSIKEALYSAEKAKEEMALLTTNNEKIILQAKKERDELLKEAREIKKQLIAEAKEEANTEAEKILKTTKNQITNEKMKALTELKNEVADLAIEMTEKIVKLEISDKKKQKTYISKALKENNNS